MNVLSLFDGMSCGRLALHQAGIKVDKYYTSEIDKYAAAVARYNWPDNIELGDINNWMVWDIDWSSIDLVIGGSPCTNLSNAGNGKGLKGEQSRLFYVFVNILNRVRQYNPNVKFLLENVKMKKAWKEEMSEFVGVEPVLINSALVSAQNRERLYWCNWPVSQPDDKGIYLKDVVFGDAVFFDSFSVSLHNLYGGFKEKEARTFTDKSPTIRTAAGGGHIPSLLLSEQAIEYMNRQVADGRTHWDFGHHSDVREPKPATVVANFFKGVPYNVLKDWNCIRKYHPTECERLQTVPDDYTKYGWINSQVKEISNTQRYKMIGNGWTVDIIKHILQEIK